MKKSELKNGAVVQLRNGYRCLKIDNTLIEFKNYGYIPLYKYDEDLNDSMDKGSDIVKVNNDVSTDLGCCSKAILNYRFNKWTWERQEEILDEVEKRYLKNVVRPFKNDIVYIAKRISKFYDNKCEYLIFKMKDNIYDFTLPYFKTNSMYKGMELNKKYTLEELSL